MAAAPAARQEAVTWRGLVVLVVVVLVVLLLTTKTTMPIPLVMKALLVVVTGTSRLHHY